MPEFTGYPARNGRLVYPRRQPRRQSGSPGLTPQVLQPAPAMGNLPRDWVRTPLTYTGLLSTRSAQFPLPARPWPPIGNGTGGNQSASIGITPFVPTAREGVNVPEQGELERST